MKTFGKRFLYLGAFFLLAIFSVFLAVGGVYFIKGSSGQIFLFVLSLVMTLGFFFVMFINDAAEDRKFCEKNGINIRPLRGFNLFLPVIVLQLILSGLLLYSKYYGFDFLTPYKFLNSAFMPLFAVIARGGTSLVSFQTLCVIAAIVPLFYLCLPLLYCLGLSKFRFIEGMTKRGGKR